MKIMESQLREIIRKIIHEQTAPVAALTPGQQITSWEQLETLKPGDQLERNGLKITFLGLFDEMISYTIAGKAVRKSFDVRDYLDWGDGESTGDVLKYIGPGVAPTKTRLPPRKKGPGYSYSIYD